MKTLCIFEFGREDSDNECEWFVADASLSYEELREKAYEHLLETVYSDPNDEPTIEDVKDWCWVVNLYTIDKEIIREIYESYK